MESDEDIIEITEQLQNVTIENIPVPENMVGHIYKATNKTTGMHYIGQTKSLKMNHGKWSVSGYERRWKDHVSSALRGDNGCTAISDAIRKYGKDDWELTLLQECEMNERDHYEMFYIKEYNSLYPMGYNMTSGGQSNIIVSEETSKRMSAAFTKVWQKEGMAEKFSSSHFDHYDIAKVDRVNERVKDISICKLNVNTCKSRKREVHDIILLLFYDEKSAPVGLSEGSDSNIIHYGGAYVTIYDSLKRISLFLNHFNNFKIEFLDENLERVFNEFKEGTYTNTEENVIQKQGISQNFDNTKIGKNDLKKVKKVQDNIKNIKLCRMNINKNKTPEGIAYDMVNLRFYGEDYKPFVISGNTTNNIRYGGAHVSVDEALQRAVEFLSYFEDLELEIADKTLEQKYNAITQNVLSKVEENILQEDNIEHEFDTTQFNKKDLAKIKIVQKYIDHISICKLSINLKTLSGTKYNTIVLHFYDKHNKPVILTGNNNRIKYDCVKLSVDDCLPKIIAFLNLFKKLQVKFLNKDLELKYNALMQSTSSFQDNNEECNSLNTEEKDNSSDNKEEDNSSDEDE